MYQTLPNSFVVSKIPFKVQIHRSENPVFKRVVWIVLLICAFIAPLQAQAPLWTAWLFNPADGSITQVNNNGEIVGAFGLPLPQAFNAYGQEMMISPTGRYVLYTATDTTVERPNRQLFVYDSEAQAVSFTYDITDVEETSFSVSPNRNAFDERHSQVVVGLLRETGWEIIVVDYSIGTVLTSLTPDKAEMVEDGLPLIQYYDGVSVFFTVAGTAYEWQIGNDEVSENQTFGPAAAAMFEGEVITADQNVMSVFPSLTDEGITVYNDAASVIEDVHYIQNGERVLLTTYTQDTDERALKLLNRDGSIGGELIGSLDDIHGTPDGFIGLFASEGGAALAFVDTTGGELNPVTVWTMEGVDFESITLAHVQSDVPPPTSLPEWTELTNNDG